MLTSDPVVNGYGFGGYGLIDIGLLHAIAIHFETRNSVGESGTGTGGENERVEKTTGWVFVVFKSPIPQQHSGPTITSRSTVLNSTQHHVRGLKPIEAGPFARGATTSSPWTVMSQARRAFTWTC